MSGLFGSTTIKGTRLTDFTGTSAEVGRAIAFGYGTFPVDGFIGWAPLPPVEHRQVKRQGKGGVKQETFTYTLSYAVFFCKGPIYGFKWIKRNGKVVYTTDPNAPLEDQEYAAKWVQRVNFHYGTPDQLPDSLIESYEGVGNVSGFPNSSYITIEDEDVTDNGGAPPNYEACVVRGAARSYTTPPYAALDVGASAVQAVGRDGYSIQIPIDEADVVSSAIDGVRRLTLIQYALYDEMNVTSAARNGTRAIPLQSYSTSDATDVASAALNGTRTIVLISYLNYAPEEINVASVALNGTRT